MEPNRLAVRWLGQSQLLSPSVSPSKDLALWGSQSVPALWREPAGEEWKPQPCQGSGEEGLPAPVKSQGLQLTALQQLQDRPWARPAKLSHPETPETQKLWENTFSVCFKLLNVGIVCNAAAQN